MTARVRAALAAAADRVWYDDGLAARAGRALLQPAAWLYGRAVAARTARFDRGAELLDDGVPTPVPALSVGNLTVGGTGKTPVASWVASTLLQRGAAPAILLRGYGDDEWRVHERLNPRAPVFIGADRLASMRAAASRGCDCVVLDDAFQHRRAPRVVDWVLVSADRWPHVARLLPAGPFREPLDAVRRASALLVTVKAAPDRRVDEVAARLAEVAPKVPRAIVRLVQGQLHRVAGGEEGRGPIDAGHAGALLAVSAIGDPTAFESQLEAHGGLVRRRLRYPDHHAYGEADLDQIVRLSEGCAGVVCTLKDAVKLAPQWPATAVPLWYVSQAVLVESGLEVLVGGIDRVLSARLRTAPTPG
ncbi:MAG: tetraacyldisaccharide 4'-kinase [Gemmatimonadetes bacterium]|nr:tetraacyldisaccharide 4'-kinase [Gemmatimonadota bacterium]